MIGDIPQLVFKNACKVKRLSHLPDDWTNLSIVSLFCSNLCIILLSKFFLLQLVVAVSLQLIRDHNLIEMRLFSRLKVSTERKLLSMLIWLESCHSSANRIAVFNYECLFCFLIGNSFSLFRFHNSRFVNALFPFVIFLICFIRFCLQLAKCSCFHSLSGVGGDAISTFVNIAYFVLCFWSCTMSDFGFLLNSFLLSFFGAQIVSYTVTVNYQFPDLANGLIIFTVLVHSAGYLEVEMIVCLFLMFFVARKNRNSNAPNSKPQLKASTAFLYTFFPMCLEWACGSDSSMFFAFLSWERLLLKACLDR